MDAARWAIVAVFIAFLLATSAQLGFD